VRIGIRDDGQKSEAYKYGKTGGHYLGCVKAFAEATLDMERSQ